MMGCGDGREEMSFGKNDRGGSELSGRGRLSQLSLSEESRARLVPAKCTINTPLGSAYAPRLVDESRSNISAA